MVKRKDKDTQSHNSVGCGCVFISLGIVSATHKTLRNNRHDTLFAFFLPFSYRINRKTQRKWAKANKCGGGLLVCAYFTSRKLDSKLSKKRLAAKFVC